MIRFVPISTVLVIHSELLREFGGKPGLRDRGLLESALDRPRNLEAYESADIYRLAAAYAFGIIKNHPFIDGNKRIGLVTAYTFLRINGIELNASEEEAVIVIEGMAAGTLGEKELEEWLRENSVET